METITALEAEKIIIESKIKFLTVETIKKLFSASSNTAHKMLMRWKKYGMIKGLHRNIYVLNRTQVSDYEIANQLVTPSYISLETALNYYGILSQFSYSITSLTTGKSRKTNYGNKEFEYSKISLRLYWGYTKQNGALIASAEKAVLDTLYFASKKLRTAHIEEWDLSHINRKIFQEYAKKVRYIPFRNILLKSNLL